MIFLISPPYTSTTRRLYPNFPAAVDLFSCGDIVFGDGGGGDLFYSAYVQLFHAGVKILVVGREKNRGPVFHQPDNRLEKQGVIFYNIKMTVLIPIKLKSLFENFSKTAYIF